LTVALPAQWSQCAWLMSRILVSLNLNPSFSTLSRIIGTEESRLLLIRMLPSGVAIR
jgi:hypothetical protein